MRKYLTILGFIDFIMGPVVYRFVIYPLIPEEYLTYSGIPELSIMITLFLAWIFTSVFLILGGLK